MLSPSSFLQVMWRCQPCLYSLSCWERPPESVVFEIASSINIKSKQKKNEEMGEGDLALERGMVVSELGS